MNAHLATIVSSKHRRDNKKEAQKITTAPTNKTTHKHQDDTITRENKLARSQCEMPCIIL